MTYCNLAIIAQQPRVVASSATDCHIMTLCYQPATTHNSACKAEGGTQHCWRCKPAPAIGLLFPPSVSKAHWCTYTIAPRAFLACHLGMIGFHQMPLATCTQSRSLARSISAVASEARSGISRRIGRCRRCYCATSAVSPESSSSSSSSAAAAAAAAAMLLDCVEAWHT